MKEVVKAVKAYEEAINHNRLIASICNTCQDMSIPPRQLCRKCGSEDIDFTTVEGRGKLLTWTVIHIGPPTHTEKVPYILGIVEFENGERLTGLLDLPPDTEPSHLMELVVGFEEGQEGVQRLRWRVG